MADLFRTEQDLGNIRTPGIGEGGSPSVNTSARFGLARGFGSIADAASTIGGIVSSSHRAEGKFLADVRSRLVRARNRGEFFRAKFDAEQQALNKFGTHEGQRIIEGIGQVTAPRTVFENGKVYQVDMLNRKNELSIPTTGQNVIKGMMRQAATAEQYAPVTSRATKVLMDRINTERAKIGAAPIGQGSEFGGLINAQNNVLNTMMFIHRNQELMQNTKGMMNKDLATTFNDTEFQQAVTSQLSSMVAASYNSFFTPSLLDAMTSSSTVTAADVGRLVSAFTSDLNQALTENGAAQTFGIDMAALNDAQVKAQKAIVDWYNTAQTNRRTQAEHRLNTNIKVWHWNIAKVEEALNKKYNTRENEHVEKWLNFNATLDGLANKWLIDARNNKLDPLQQWVLSQSANVANQIRMESSFANMILPGIENLNRVTVPGDTPGKKYNKGIEMLNREVTALMQASRAAKSPELLLTGTGVLGTGIDNILDQAAEAAQQIEDPGERQEALNEIDQWIKNFDDWAQKLGLSKDDLFAIGDNARAILFERGTMGILGAKEKEGRLGPAGSPRGLPTGNRAFPSPNLPEINLPKFSPPTGKTRTRQNVQ